MKDADILELFFARDEQALREVRQKYGGLCFSIADNILHNGRDAEECVNDTYLAVWRAIPPEKPEKLSAFLAKIVRNRAINRYRHEHNRKRDKDLDLLWSELSEEVAAPDKTQEALDELHVAGVINRYLHEVSADKAMVFVLRYHFYFSVEEISRRTGFSYSKTASILYRMREALRKRLGEEGINV